VCNVFGYQIYHLILKAIPKKVGIYINENTCVSDIQIPAFAGITNYGIRCIGSTITYR
jgi:hypothetical protein